MNWHCPDVGLDVDASLRLNVEGGSNFVRSFLCNFRATNAATVIGAIRDGTSWIRPSSTLHRAAYPASESLIFFDFAPVYERTLASLIPCL